MEARQKDEARERGTGAWYRLQAANASSLRGETRWLLSGVKKMEERKIAQDKKASVLLPLISAKRRGEQY